MAGKIDVVKRQKEKKAVREYLSFNHASARPLFEDAGAAHSWHPPLLVPFAIFGPRLYRPSHFVFP
jgi:hypothetical protein